MNVVFLETTQSYGYTFSAANTKVELLARGLSKAGDTCVIHNGVVGSSFVNQREILEKDFCKVITYPKKSNQFISWLFNVKQLYHDLKECYKKDQVNMIILEAPDYHIYILHIILARILNYKISVISHEWGPTVKTVHPLRKPFVWLYTKTFGYMADGILPISEYIIKRIKHFNKPYLKVPILADFTEDDLSTFDSTHPRPYFLYCVYAAYFRIISVTIDAYARFLDLYPNAEHDLVFVLGGSDNQVKVVSDYIKKKGLEKNIIIKRKLPYMELLSTYKGADALVIPLDPYNEQDEARFSQKIAEYTSSKRPILTNWVGEIKYYFHPYEDIIIMEEYSLDGFVKAFNWIEQNKDNLNSIGEAGYKVGLNYFNYEKMGVELHSFLLTI